VVVEEEEVEEEEEDTYCPCECRRHAGIWSA
jgi:hypothetical protein